MAALVERDAVQACLSPRLRRTLGELAGHHGSLDHDAGVRPALAQPRAAQDVA
jgi:hypothetical protein